MGKSKAKRKATNTKTITGVYSLATLQSDEIETCPRYAKYRFTSNGFCSRRTCRSS